MKIGTVEIELWDVEGVTGSGPPAVITERMVEVPLAQWFLQQYGPDVVEVGAVTPYYYPDVRHSVVDPGDSWDGCRKEDAHNLDYSGKNLLSISTVEHIGNPELLLEKMFKADKWLITWAAGYKKSLDAHVESTGIPSLKVFRKEHSVWELRDSIVDVPYDKPFPYGNAIYILTNCEELLPS